MAQEKGSRKGVMEKTNGKGIKGTNKGTEGKKKRYKGEGDTKTDKG